MKNPIPCAHGNPDARERVSRRGGPVPAHRARADRPVPSMPTGSPVPNSAFFLGLGASANWTNFGHQHVYAIGTSNVFTDGVLSASGSAQGPTNILMDSRFAFAPSFQGGYFQRFGASDWLWGAKLSYNYLGATSTNYNSIIPQFGTYTTIAEPDARAFQRPSLCARRPDECLAGNRSDPIPRPRFRSKLRLRRRRSDPFADPDPVERPGRFCLCRWRDRGSIRRAPGLLELELALWRRGGRRRHLLSHPDLVSRFELHLRRDEGHTAKFASPFVDCSSTSVGTLVGNSAWRAETQRVGLTINRAF